MNSIKTTRTTNANNCMNSKEYQEHRIFEMMNIFSLINEINAFALVKQCLFKRLLEGKNCKGLLNKKEKEKNKKRKSINCRKNQSHAPHP